MSLKKETHGNRECYDAGGCRCGPCTEAWREYKRGYEAKRYHTLVANPITREHEHGTEKGYRSGCRRDCCKEAWRRYKTERRRAAGVPVRPRGKGAPKPRVKRERRPTIEASEVGTGAYSEWLKERGLLKGA